MRPGRYAADDGSFGRSVGSAAARGAGLLAVALILGIVLLHAFDTGTDPYSSSLRALAPASTSTTARTRAVTPSSTTTQATRPPSEVKVLPANGSGTVGAGGKAGDVLKKAGYDVLAAVNTTRTVQSSTVEFAPGFEVDARAVAQVLGLAPAAVKAMPSPPPVADTRGVDVLVVVGPDLARALAAATPPTSTRATSTATTRRTTTATTRSSPTGTR